MVVFFIPALAIISIIFLILLVAMFAGVVIFFFKIAFNPFLIWIVVITISLWFSSKIGLLKFVLSFFKKEEKSKSKVNCRLKENKGRKICKK